MLPLNPHPISSVRFSQVGTLRTDPGRDRWLKFRATHVAYPNDISFAWTAKVQVAPFIHIRVRDALECGWASGRVSLCVIPIKSTAGTRELNSGALHRFLAEVVWYPTALLPSKNLHWTPIDHRRAMAILSDSQSTVALEFTFNDRGEVSRIFTPSRWATFGDGFKQLPWEGHFRNYENHNGMLVPSEAEVGWYVGGKWETVWKARFTDFYFAI